MENLKKRETELINRNTMGYYCCKTWHENLYGEISGVYAPYISKLMVVQLQHDLNTHTNETMNILLASYLPNTQNLLGYNIIRRYSYDYG